ncbi:MAG: methionine--tRNA ligase, partial [Anaerolineae bacterium]
MPEKILVFTAWPYCNGELHIGHIAGAYLPPDIFARYHRLRGNEVLMLSGSDTHGTPITVRAEEEGVTPREIVDRYHPRIVDMYQRLGISYDLYTETDTENHWAVTQDMFKAHLANGYIYLDTMQQLYCVDCAKWLADRYVEGVCPYCGYEGARGDQCDNCGRTYDATALVRPRCKHCGGTHIETRTTQHFFLDLGKLNDPLLAWINDGKKEHWRPNVINQTRARLESRELRGRPITRDIQWGVTIPVVGFEDKRIYVWYDAVIGYLSATKEWAALNGASDAWRAWWTDPTCRAYYFIGKDNIEFHTIIWPGMLIGYGQGLNLPYDVPSNEYLNVEGRKLSKSRRWMIVMSDVLDRYDPDPWRYAIAANFPETQDVNFTWEDFLRRNNDELVATWGNLANRVLGFAFKRFDAAVPAPGPFDEADRALLDQ